MSIYEMETHISKLERENKELRDELAGLYPFHAIHNNESGLERADCDEAVEETYVRLILESPTFQWTLEHDDAELMMLGIAQECLGWIASRKLS